MADPFSIAAGSIGLLDVCWRFGRYLKHLQAGAAEIDNEIASLSREVKELEGVSKAIQASYTGSQASLYSEEENLGAKQISNLWREIASNIADSRQIVEELEILVKLIVGKESTTDSSTFTAKINRYRKQLRRESKEDGFFKLQSRLKTYYSALQLRLSLIIAYWGIFWINASSDQLAEQTFKEIAKIGKVDESMRAAKHWLSNRRDQWLLIIDNADDVRLDLHKYLPEGERGHVLITTRVPSNKRFGTVGSRALHFEGLKDDDANCLLLKTATTPTPWDSSIHKLATSITKALGYLPLALIHAGKAVMNKLCKLDEYLNYYKVERQRVREAQGIRDDDNIYMNVYSSFEINFRGLQNKGTTAADNAVQLLQLFSFFHNENIRVDFLAKAATNPAVERDEQNKEKAREAGRTSNQAKMSWSAVFKEYMSELGAFLYKERTPPVLSLFLRGSVAFDRYGVNEALYQLSQLSLITYNEINDSYSMHPVVHIWARERPDFHIIEQAVWCRAALTTLAQCILLPPLASSEADERLRRDLLPHIDHAREQQREIDQRIKKNRQRCKTAWLHGRKNVSRLEIGQMARFSRVYAQGGKWDEALQLQHSVKDFCLDWLGPNHDSTMRVKLALSGTYWQLGRGDEAAELQEQVLRTCEASRGDKDKMTLIAMDTLGESRFLQGRYTDSLKLHDSAYKGNTIILGPGHQDTLKAAKNLGRGYAGLYQLEQARKFLKRAVSGMIRNVNLGPTYLDTLIAMEELALSYLEEDRGTAESTPIELEQAYKLMTEVFSKREKKLGKEHPFTLYATLNLARVKAAKGDLEDAEADIRASLLIAESILDSQHLGILCGKLHLGRILLKREHFKEAEDVLLEVANCHRTRSGEHPDRCKALEVLANCYMLQGRRGEAVKKCEEAIDGLKILKGHDHPYMERLQSQYEELTRSSPASTPDHSPSRERDEPLLVKKAATFA
ncbi:hypothetical protein ACLMJK_000067 [Lecanora helva]